MGVVVVDFEGFYLYLFVFCCDDLEGLVSVVCFG